MVLRSRTYMECLIDSYRLSVQDTHHKSAVHVMGDVVSQVPVLYKLAHFLPPGTPSLSVCLSVGMNAWSQMGRQLVPRPAG